MVNYEECLEENFLIDCLLIRDRDTSAQSTSVLVGQTEPDISKKCKDLEHKSISALHSSSPTNLFCQDGTYQKLIS